MSGVASVPRDVILSLCFVTWEDAHRRGMHFPPDRLIAALIADPRVGRLIVVDPFRDRVRTLAKRALGRTLDPVETIDDLAVGHLRPLRSGRRDPTDIPALERQFGRYDRLVEHSAGAAGLERPVVITTSPLAAGFASFDWAGPVTFYAWDDWAVHPTYRPWWPAFDEVHRRIRERGTRMCAVSQAILDRARPSGPALVIPNGVDPPEWTGDALAPAWFGELPAPRLLYAGTLDSRIDTDMVVRTAERFPEGSIVLVGLIADADHLAPLRDLPNVHIHPAVPREQITGLIRASDACLVPHARTDLTLAMSPLKLYEYVAGGRPVAATDLPPMRGISPRVVLTAAGGDFPAAVERALELGPAPEPERLEFVRANSWAGRHAALLDLAFG